MESIGPVLATPIGAHVVEVIGCLLCPVSIAGSE
jgi:hypothetical protein